MCALFGLETTEGYRVPSIETGGTSKVVTFVLKLHMNAVIAVKPYMDSLGGKG